MKRQNFNYWYKKQRIKERILNYILRFDMMDVLNKLSST